MNGGVARGKKVPSVDEKEKNYSKCPYLLLDFELGRVLFLRLDSKYSVLQYIAIFIDRWTHVSSAYIHATLHNTYTWTHVHM